MVSVTQGARLDRFEVERVLGQGGHGVVAVVRHLHLGSRHALKLLHLANPARTARLVREGKIQATLRHPHIVSVTDVVELDGAIGLVMELVEGPDLHSWLCRHRPDEAEVDALAEQLFAALTYAHASGVVHRDVKPENVLVARVGDQLHLRLADFGLAMDALDSEGRLTADGTAMGTPLYMAPELYVDAHRADARADVFGLGALLYEMLAGLPPFPPGTVVQTYEAASQGRYTPLPSRNPDVPGRMVRAIDAALSPDPAARPADVAALRAIWRGGLPSPAPVFSKGALEAASVAMSAPPVAVVRADATPPGTLAPHGGVSPTVPVTVAPSMVTPTAPPPRRPSWELAVLAFGAVGLLGMGASIGVGMWFWFAKAEDTSMAPPVPAEVAEVATLPVGSGASGEGTAAGEEPTPVVVPTPDMTPSSSPVSASAPRTVAPAPPPAEPSAAGAPAAPAPARTEANLVVTGVERARLRGASGTIAASGRVPAGGYRLFVRFAGDTEDTEVMELTLAPGDRRVITCAAGLRVCK